MVEFHKFLDALEEFIAIKVRQAQSLGSLLKPVHIAFRPEESDLAFVIFVSFHALVALHSVVKSRVKSMHFDGLKRGDFGCRPA
jgi:hypothetical protein